MKNLNPLLDAASERQKCHSENATAANAGPRISDVFVVLEEQKVKPEG